MFRLRIGCEECGVVLGEMLGEGENLGAERFWDRLASRPPGHTFERFLLRGGFGAS